jgi:hypothetical protein
MPRKSTKPSEAAKPSSTSNARASEPTHSLDEAIQRRAYELHLERGGAHGGDLDDWLRAEREVQTQHPPTTTGRRTTKKKA